MNRKAGYFSGHHTQQRHSEVPSLQVARPVRSGWEDSKTFGSFQLLILHPVESSDLRPNLQLRLGPSLVRLTAQRTRRRTDMFC